MRRILAAFLSMMCVTINLIASAEQDGRPSRTEVIMLEGMEETITTRYFESHLGYSLWMDEHIFMHSTEMQEGNFDSITSAFDPSGEFQVHIRRAGDVLRETPPYTYEEAVRYLKEQFAESYGKIEEISAEGLFSGCPARAFESVALDRSRVAYEYILESSEGSAGQDALCVFICYPPEAREGFGARVLHMLKSLKIREHEPERQGGDIGYVLCDVLSVREAPDTSTAAMASVSYRSKLHILEYQENWLRIQYENADGGQAVAGWVNRDYVLEDPKIILTATETAAYAYGDANAKRVGLIRPETELLIIGELDDFYIVSFRGASAFIKK